MLQYHDLLNKILSSGKKHDDRTGVGTLSVFGAQNRYDLRNGMFPLVTTKKLSFRWIIEELLWFISGSTDVNDLRLRCKKPITIWDEWATAEKCAKHGFPEGQLGPIYGHQWRNFGASKSNGSLKRYDPINRRYINYGYMDNGHDQLQQLIDNLQNNPRSRRLILSGWNPIEADQVELPPCHTLFQLKWDENTNELSGQLYQRSADVFLGVPYNIASYSALICILAKYLNMNPGDFVHSIGDAHIYKSHIKVVEEQLSRQIRPLPTLTISSFNSLFDVKHSDLLLTGYYPHEPLTADVAI